MQMILLQISNQKVPVAHDPSAFILDRLLNMIAHMCYAASRFAKMQLL